MYKSALLFSATLNYLFDLLFSYTYLCTICFNVKLKKPQCFSSFFLLNELVYQVWRIFHPFMRLDLLKYQLVFFTDKEQMPAQKSPVRIFASLCLEKSSLVFALTVSRLSTILLMERFRVNARTVLMNWPTELAPSKMELAGMFVCLFSDNQDEFGSLGSTTVFIFSQMLFMQIQVRYLSRFFHCLAHETIDAYSGNILKSTICIGLIMC